MAETEPGLTLEYILLGLLREQPDHGYALFERVQSTPELSLIWQVKRSKLYYLLEKLADEGLLSSQVEQGEGYPDRKIYHLTESGRDAFQRWLLEPVSVSRYVRIAFLSKLYFALQMERNVPQGLIASQLAVCQRWLEDLERQEAEVPAGDFISRQVFRFRIGQISAMISWLKECRDQIP